MPLYNVGTGVALPDLIYHDTENDTWEDSDGNDLDLAYFDYDENYTGEVDGVSGDTVSIAIVQPTSWDEEQDEPSAEHKLVALGSILYESTGPDPLILTFEEGPEDGTFYIYVEGEYGEEDILFATTVTPVDINVGDEYTVEEMGALEEQYSFQQFDSEQNVITANLGDQVTVLAMRIEGDPETDPENTKVIVTNKGEAEAYYDGWDTFRIKSYNFDSDASEVTLNVAPPLEDGDVYKYILLTYEPSISAVGETITTSSGASGWHVWDGESAIYVPSNTPTLDYIQLAECDANDVCKKDTWVNFRESSTVTLAEYVTELNGTSDMQTIGVASVSGDDIAIAPSQQFTQILQALEGGQSSAVATYWEQMKAALVRLSADAANSVDPDPSVNVIYNNQTVFSAKAGTATYNKYN